MPRVAVAVDELLAGVRMREDTNVETVRQTVRQDADLVCQRDEVVFCIGCVLLGVKIIVVIFVLILWFQLLSDWCIERVF